MIKHFLLWLVALCCLSACVDLTPAGARVRVLREPQQVEMAACTPLGQVRVSSEDALRNAAVDLAGDTAVMGLRHVNGSTYVRGFVYDCGLGPQQATAPLPAAASPSPVTAGEPHGPDRSEKCRLKGGHWHEGWCVIDID